MIRNDTKQVWWIPVYSGASTWHGLGIFGNFGDAWGDHDFSAISYLHDFMIF